MSKVVDRVAAKAASVERIHREHQAALGDEAAAELDVLDGVHEALLPALPALCSRLPGSFNGETRGDGQPPGDKESAHRDERGCVLINAFKRDNEPGGRRGRYFGDLLVVLPNGAFAVVEREGKWSSIPGEQSGWSTSLREIEPAEVIALYGVEQVVAAILRVLDAQLSGAATRRTSEAVERTEKLRAVSVLLQPDRTLLPGLRVSMARKLWLAGEPTGFPAGDVRLDTRDAVAAYARQIPGRVVWHRRHADEVSVVLTDEGRVIAISDAHGPWGVMIGLLDERGRFQAVGAGGPSAR